MSDYLWTPQHGVHAAGAQSVVPAHSSLTHQYSSAGGLGRGAPGGVEVPPPAPPLPLPDNVVPIPAALPARFADPLASERERQWEARAQFRARCRQSLYYFTKTVACALIEPNTFPAEVFKESCDLIQRTLEYHKRLLLEDPRFHAKSQRTSIAIPLWIAIQRAGGRDPVTNVCYDTPDEIARAEAYLAIHKNIRGTDTRIAIVSEKEEKAEEWVTASKAHWETNALLRWAFPELIWPSFHTRAYGYWESGRYTLPNRKNPTDPNPFLRAIGIRGGSSGSRVDILIIDDLLSEMSCESPTELAYRRNYVRSISLLIEDRAVNDPQGSAVLLVTNRWNLDDPNSMIHDEHPEWQIYRRAAAVCKTHGYGNCGRLRSDSEGEDCILTNIPLWKVRVPSLASLRQQLGDRIYAVQCLNRPTQESDLKSDKLLDFRMEVRNTAPDPETGQGGGRREMHVVIPEQRDRAAGTVRAMAEAIGISQFLHIIMIDPAGAAKESSARQRGLTARWCATWYAFDPVLGRVFTLDIRCDHYTPDEGIEAAYGLWLQACNMTDSRIPIACERVGCQTLVGTALRLRAQQDQITLPTVIDQPKPTGIAKDNYIRQRTGWRLNQGQLYVRQDLEHPRVEIRHFPGSIFKDWLDTEAMAEEYFMSKQGPGAGKGKARADRRKMSRRIYATRLAVARDTGRRAA